MDCYTANWNPLGEETFYRKLELYSMEWGLREDLRDCVVAAAPYGGPIALLRNSRRDKTPGARPLLEIYSASGLLLASVPWKSGRLVHLGWTAGEDLLCIQEDGTVLVYNLFCEFKRHFSMGNEVLQNHVLEAQVFHTEFGTGVAILTGALRFSLATNIDDLKLRRLPEVPGKVLRVQHRRALPAQADGLVHAAPEPAASRGAGLGAAADGEASQEIFRIASMAPGALLLEAQKEYEKESQKADEYLREIREQQLLPEAVGQCIEAAGYEHEPETQKSLLRAASFGKCFLDKFPPEGFVRMCQDLRVLNAIRDYQIGIPLTFTQYKQLTIEVLLDRLVLRRLYPLAIRICEFLRLPEIQGVSRILAHWACYKVQQKDKSDEEVAQAINQKLGDTAGISYSDIATRAYDCGRTELAIKLLEYEPRSGEQVPLLLKMKRSKLALGKAIESGDTDLALSLYHQFCRHQERETLKDLYNQDDNHQELGNLHVQGGYCQQRIEGRVAALQNALDEFYKAKNDFAAKATEEQIKLLRLQRHLQEELDKPYLDLSLHDTVATLILDGHHKRAEQLYRDFRIPDKRYWWLKINALATRGDWEEMEKFSKSKKSPIGYLPFVEVAVKHHNRYEAKKYAPRVPPEQRVKAFVLVGDLEQAAEAAIERKNEAEMSLVLARCSAGTDGAVAEKLNRARAQLLKK
ncbi:hypothetical protein IHE44_0012775 [Lamprotornis superbus]|uniref:Vacuolar protein sorting-associated protein 16 homolog n=1 Tax=Lamprotornis superbus TaxID=245042 RepID=A0A835NN03_9PASS|nr:hypothetical protein IHE44_0012775 [Lamprotornis superbus]